MFQFRNEAVTDTRAADGYGVCRGFGEPLGAVWGELA